MKHNDVGINLVNLNSQTDSSTSKDNSARLCQFCKIRAATLHFGDMLSFTHGGINNCCEICCTEQQLIHAKERAAAIPALEEKLTKLMAEQK